MKKELHDLFYYLKKTGNKEEAEEIRKIATGVSVQNGNISANGHSSSLSTTVSMGITSSQVRVKVISIQPSIIPKQNTSGYHIVGSGYGMQLDMFVDEQNMAKIQNAVAAGTESSILLEYYGPKGNPNSRQILITPAQ